MGIELYTQTLSRIVDGNLAQLGIDLHQSLPNVVKDLMDIGL
jgi:hypothetical protein